MPGEPIPAPPPVPADQVLELNIGGTLPIPSAVPLGGEVGLIWGPGWTDFAVTGLGGAYAGGRVAVESRPARQPGWTGEAKVSGEFLGARGEGVLSTDLSTLDWSGKLNAGPFYGGASGQLLPEPSIDDVRGGRQSRFQNSTFGFGLSGAAGARYTSPTVNLYDMFGNWLGFATPAQPTPPGQTTPTPPATPDPPLLDAPLPPTETPTTPEGTQHVVPDGTNEVTPETPAVETPAVETPALETPAVETPSVETPAEIPTYETPAIEPPAIEPPAIEPPAYEVPAVEIPTFEMPAIAPPMTPIEPLPAFEPAPISSIHESYDPFSTIDTGLDTSFSTLGTGMSTLDTDMSSFDTGLDTSYSTLDTGLSSFDTGLSSFDTGMSSFDSGFSSFDSGGFSGGDF